MWWLGLSGVEDQDWALGQQQEQEAAADHHWLDDHGVPESTGELVREVTGSGAGEGARVT